MRSVRLSGANVVVRAGREQLVARREHAPQPMHTTRSAYNPNFDMIEKLELVKYISN